MKIRKEDSDNVKMLSALKSPKHHRKRARTSTIIGEALLTERYWNNLDLWTGKPRDIGLITETDLKRKATYENNRNQTA
jgi:hypothetical protein